MNFKIFLKIFFLKIGWRPFYKEYSYRMPIVYKLINIVYPILIISLLLYSYGYDAVTCQGKLNPMLDTVVN